MDTTDKQKLEEAGAFWIKKSKTGNTFLTGTVKSKSGEEIKVIVFKNKYKTEGSNQPDYRIYFDNAPIKQSEAPVKPVKAAKAEKIEPNKNLTEEIPF